MATLGGTPGRLGRSSGEKRALLHPLAHRNAFQRALEVSTLPDRAEVWRGSHFSKMGGGPGFAVGLVEESAGPQGVTGGEAGH